MSDSPIPLSPSAKSTSSRSPTTTTTTSSLRGRRGPYPCRRERLSIMAHIKPYHRSHMRTRLKQFHEDDGAAFSADPEVLLELRRRRVDGGISLEGGFTLDEQLKAIHSLHGVAGEEGVGGPLVAWGQGSNGSIFGGRPVDGPVADRSGAAGADAGVVQPTQTSRQRSEQDELLAGIGSWTAGTGGEQVEHDLALIDLEERIEESAYPLVRASPAA